jgi:hypothetical protein
VGGSRRRYAFGAAAFHIPQRCATLLRSLDISMHGSIDVSVDIPMHIYMHILVDSVIDVSVHCFHVFIDV